AKNAIDLGDGPQQCGPINPVEHKIYNDQIKPRLRIKGKFSGGGAQELNQRKLVSPVLKPLALWPDGGDAATEALANFVQPPTIAGTNLEHASRREIHHRHCSDNMIIDETFGIRYSNLVSCEPTITFTLEKHFVLVHVLSNSEHTLLVT